MGFVSVIISSSTPLLSLGSNEWDVFDGSGRFLGPIEMPKGFQPIVSDDQGFLGIWRDDLHVQHIMGVQVVRTGSR